MDWIYAHWWRGDNFGDSATPYLIEKLSGKRAVWAQPRPGIVTYMVTGSILTSPASEHCIIWGCGIIDTESPILRPLEICAVRGKITRNRLLDCGYECPEIYGDPVLLLPRLYRPNVSKKYALGIVPHWMDLAKVYADYGSEREVLIVHVNDPVERVIRDILSCEKIVSSSLHGIVAADAYGIPNHRVEFSDEVHGRNIKFCDYWSAVGIDPYDPLDLRSKQPILEIVNAVKPRPIQIDLDRLLEVCPFRR